MKFDVSKFQTNHRRFSLSIPVLCSDGQLTKIFILDDICPLLVLCAELSCGRSATLLAAAGSWLLYCVPLVQLEWQPLRCVYNYSDFSSTAIQLHCDHSTTYVRTELLQCGIDKQAVDGRAAAMICLHPQQVDNVFVFIRQVAPVLACWLFKTAATSWPLTLKVVSRVMCDVGYLCANFGLPRPLCSQVTPDVRDRQTSDIRQTKASLNASALWGRRHNK